MINHRTSQTATVALSVFLSEHRDVLIASAGYLSGPDLEQRVRNMLGDMHVTKAPIEQLLREVRTLRDVLYAAARSRANAVTFTSEPIDEEFANRADIDRMLNHLDGILADIEADDEIVFAMKQRRSFR